MLADDVDGAFPCGGEVDEGILGIVEAAREAEDEERGVVVDHLKVGEGGEVGGGAWKRLVSDCFWKRKVEDHTILTPRRHEPNRPRYDPADQQLVIEHRRSPFLIRIEIHMLLLQTRPAVITALPRFPIGLLGLDEVELGLLAPVRSGRFHGFEIWVWVAPDMAFVVDFDFLLLGLGWAGGGVGGIVGTLFGVGEVLGGHSCGGGAGSWRVGWTQGEAWRGIGFRITT